MATPKKKVQTVTTKKSHDKKGSWLSRHKALVVIILAVIAFVVWFNSDYWPWPSQDRIRERLDKVIEICTDNENSSECKNIQKRYGMTFRYCHSIGDSSTRTVYLNGRPFQMPYFPWYAVAWEGDSSEPPKNGKYSFSPYYGCQEHRE